MDTKQKVLAVLAAFNELQEVLDRDSLDKVINVLPVLAVSNLQNDLDTADPNNKVLAVLAAFNELPKDTADLNNDVLAMLTAFNNLRSSLDTAIKVSKQILPPGSIKERLEQIRRQVEDSA